LCGYKGGRSATAVGKGARSTLVRRVLKSLLENLWNEKVVGHLTKQQNNYEIMGSKWEIYESPLSREKGFEGGSTQQMADAEQEGFAEDKKLIDEKKNWVSPNAERKTQSLPLVGRPVEKALQSEVESSRQYGEKLEFLERRTFPDLSTNKEFNGEKKGPCWGHDGKLSIKGSV